MEPKPIVAALTSISPPRNYSANVQSYLDRGFNAVKIKVGREDLTEDVERVRAVREMIGADIAFMVDANYALSVSQSIEAANAFKPYDIMWFEEPTIPDDYTGYAEIAAATGMPMLRRWVRTFIPFTSSSSPSRNPRFRLFNRMPRTAAA